MTEWKTMESAPKDGSAFLATSENAYPADGWFTAVIWWDDTFESLDWNEDTDQLDYRGAWTAGRVGSFGYEEYAEEKPAYWMPLPSPPTR